MLYPVACITLSAVLCFHLHRSHTYLDPRLLLNHMIGVRVIVLNATFNNISVISWLSVLLVEETGVPRENN